MNKLKTIGFLFVSFAIAGNVFAVACTEKVRNQVAKTIAERDVAFMNLQIKKAHKEIELAYPAQLSANLEESYKTGVSTIYVNYVDSVKSVVRVRLDKEIEKARKDRVRESQKVLEKLEKDIVSVEKKYNRAANKVPQHNCTL